MTETSKTDIFGSVEENDQEIEDDQPEDDEVDDGRFGSMG